MDSEPLLPWSSSDVDYARPGPKHILKIALRIKQLIDIVVPIEFDPAVVERADSPVLTERVLDLVREAAGGKGDGRKGSSSRAYRATLVFVLLKVRSWYLSSAEEELHDADLYNLRASTAELVAARLIEDEADERYLFKNVLCQRYSITLHGEDSKAANALEEAVDQHATKIISTSGYQRCRKWLWRGWIIQSDEDPDNYVFYANAANTNFHVHFHPDRIKTPQYQNMMLLGFSLIYLILYTFTINTLQKTGNLDWSEVVFFLFTAGFILDELVKLYHVGLKYIGFWNAFNDTLYGLVAVSFIFRLFALNHNPESPSRIDYLQTAYRLLACCAPFVWCRLLLYLDALQFFGAMLIVLSELIKESVIFFVLLIAVSAGFFQAFIGLDASDGNVDFLNQTSELMFLTIMGNPAYDALDDLAHPYGQILYYLFSFLICTLLLNILIALFTSAYDHINDNATEEYLALLAEKTLRFVRSPDENVYVPPLNLIEITCAILPFEWWMNAETYAKMNDFYLLVLYSPILLFTAYSEAKDAKRIAYNRLRGLADDANERDQEWDLLDGYDSDESDEDDDRIRAAVTAQHNSKKRLQNGSDVRHETSAELELMNSTIAEGDPEFHIDERAWLKSVMRQAPQIELGDKSGAGWNNYWLFKEIAQVKQELKHVNKETQQQPAKVTEQARPSVEEGNTPALTISLTPTELEKLVSDAVQKALHNFSTQAAISGTFASKSAPEPSSTAADPKLEPEPEVAETKTSSSPHIDEVPAEDVVAKTQSFVENSRNKSALKDDASATLEEENAQPASEAPVDPSNSTGAGAEVSKKKKNKNKNKNKKK